MWRLMDPRAKISKKIIGELHDFVFLTISGLWYHVFLGRLFYTIRQSEN
jgi:hypothetical protein